MVTSAQTFTPAPTQVGTFQASSTPAYMNGVLWFQGTNNALWAVPVNNPSAAISPDGFATAGTPCLALDGNVYFQGTDNTLWSCGQTWPYLQNKESIYQCASSPVAPGDGYVYFQGTNGILWQVNPNVPNSGVHLQGFSISSPPSFALGSSTAYFQSPQPASPGTIQVLAGANFTVGSQGMFGPYASATLQIASAPHMANNGMLYFQLGAAVTIGTTAYVANALMQLDLTQTPSVLTQLNKPSGGPDPGFQCLSTPTTTQFGDDGYVYFQGTDNTLWQVQIANPGIAYALDKNIISAPCAPGNGHVYYVGKNNILMQCATAP